MSLEALKGCETFNNDTKNKVVSKISKFKFLFDRTKEIDTRITQRKI